MVRKIQRLLGIAAKLFRHLAGQKPKRALQPVFELIAGSHREIQQKESVCHADFSWRKGDIADFAWVKEGGRVVLELTQRYSQKGKPAEFIDSFGEYFQIPKPTSEKPIIALDNVCLQVNADMAGEGP